MGFPIILVNHTKKQVVHTSSSSMGAEDVLQFFKHVSSLGWALTDEFEIAETVNEPYISFGFDCDEHIINYYLRMQYKVSLLPC